MQLAPWLQPVFQRLTTNSDVLRGHAFLFVSPFDIGQWQLMQAVALHWLGSEQLNSPDLFQLQRVEDKRDISVDQVRLLNEWVQQTSHGTHGRVVLIPELERMNRNSANSLLKTLEEPPAGVRFLLQTPRLGRLLPTIISRCQRVSLPLPDAATALAWLQANVSQVTDEQRQLALMLHDNAPYSAQHWLLNGGLTAWQAWQKPWQQSMQHQRCSAELMQLARKDMLAFCQLLAQQAYVQAKQMTSQSYLAWQLLRQTWQVEQALQQNMSKDVLADNVFLALNDFFNGRVPQMPLSTRSGLLA